MFLCIYIYIYTHTLYAERFQINDDIFGHKEHTRSLNSSSSTSDNCTGLVCSPNSSKRVNELIYKSQHCFSKALSALQSLGAKDGKRI